MDGPWTDFQGQQQPEPADGPWSDFQQAAAPTAAAGPWDEFQPSAASDVAKSLATGAVKGGANLAAGYLANTNPVTGIPYDVAMGVKYGVPVLESGAQYLAKDIMGDKEFETYKDQFVKDHPDLAKYDPATLANMIPAPADLIAKAAAATGHPLHEPETAAGRIAEGIPEFSGLGGAAALKALPAAIGAVAVPEAVKALGGGQQAQFWGGVAGGGAGLLHALKGEPTAEPAAPTPENVSRETSQEPVIVPQTPAPSSDLSAAPSPTKDGYNIVDSDGAPVMGGFDSMDEANQHIQDVEAEKAIQEPLIEPTATQQPEAAQPAPEQPEVPPWAMDFAPPEEPSAPAEPQPLTPVQKLAGQYKGPLAEFAQKIGIPLPPEALDAAAQKLAEAHSVPVPKTQGPFAPSETPLTPEEIAKNKKQQVSINRSEAAKNKNMPAPTNIFQSIADAGGMKDEGNWLKSRDMRDVMTQYGRLYQTNGMDYDQALEHAIGQGFIPDKGDSPNPTQNDHNDLFEELEKEYSKPTRKALDTNEALEDRYGVEPQEVDAAHNTEQAMSDISPEDELERQAMLAYYGGDKDLDPVLKGEPNEERALASTDAETGKVVPDEGRQPPAFDLTPTGGEGVPRRESGTGRVPEDAQGVIAGTEPITDKELAERKMAGAAHSDVAQKAADEGLFDVSGRTQKDFGFFEPFSHENHATEEFRNFARNYPSTIEGAHDAARDFVVDYGKKTGNEALVALDRNTGYEKFIEKSDKNNFVDGNRPEYDDPNNHLVVHHNHPSSSPLSGSGIDGDITQLSRKGMDSVIAHGNNGSFSGAKLTDNFRNVADKKHQTWEWQDLHNIIESGKRAVFDTLQKSVGDGRLTQTDADRIYRSLSEIVNRSLANNGIIDYVTSHDLPAEVDAIKKEVDAAVKKIAKERGYTNVSTTRVGERSGTVTVRPDRGNQELLRETQESTARRPIGETKAAGTEGIVGSGGRSDVLRGRSDIETGRNAERQNQPLARDAEKGEDNGPKGFSEEDARKEEWKLRKPLSDLERLTDTKLKGSIIDKAGQAYVNLIRPELVSPKALRAEARLATYKVRVQSAKDQIARTGEVAQRIQQRWTQGERFKFIENLETGNWKPDKMAGGYSYSRAAYDATHAMEAAETNADPERFYRDNYFAGAWKNPEKADAYFRSPAFIQKYGKDYFRKAKVFELQRIGREAGLEPKFDTPQEFLNYRLLSGQDMVQKMKLLKQLQDDGLATRAQAFSADTRAAKTQEMLDRTQGRLKAAADRLNDPKQPEFSFANPVVRKYTEALKDRAAKLQERMDAITQEKKLHTLSPETLKNLKNNSFRVIGPDNRVWQIHNDAGPIWKNAMDISGPFGRGLWGHDGVIGKTFRGWMAGKNSWVPIKLSLSLFHPLHVATIHLANGMATAVENIMKGGRFTDSMGALGNSLKMGFGMKTGINPMRGWGKMDDPALQALRTAPDLRTEAQQADVRTMEEGGYRPFMSEEDTVAARLNFLKALDQKELLKLPIPAAQMAIKGLAAPVFEHWIPALKTEAYLTRTRLAVKRDPSLASNDGHRAETFTQIRKDVERTYGEMNYDTLFWNKTVKDAFQASFLSAGWKLAQLNYYRGLAEPAKLAYSALKTGKFDPKSVSYNMLFSYLYGGLALTMGSIIAYNTIGRVRSLADMIDPPTGEKNADGSDIRMRLPFFNNEALALSHDTNTQGLLGGTAQFLWNQTLYKGAWDTINNKNYIGKPLVSNFGNLDEIAHAAWSQVSPISVESYDKASAKGSDVGKKLAMAGLSLAPAYVNQSPFEQKVLARYDEENGIKGTDYQDYLKEQYKAAIHNQDSAAQADLLKKMTAAGLSPHQIASTRSAHAAPFVEHAWKELSPPEQVKLFDSANPQEKAKFFPMASDAAKRQIKSGGYPNHP